MCVPKLYYEGDDNWDIFKNKFQDYAEGMDWTPSECKACLKWCLRGKAAKFCNTLLKMNEDLTYKQLLRKLGDRFGDLDLKVAVYSQFNHANEKEEESLEDWADRVRELAGQGCFSIQRKHVTVRVSFLAHLSRRLIGELIVYQWSGVRRPSVVGVVHNAQTSSSQKPLGRSKPHFMWSLLG